MALQKVDDETPTESGWELIEVTVDSGACDWVANRNVATAFKITPTEASKAGVWYRSACGTKIYIYIMKVKRLSADIALTVIS